MMWNTKSLLALLSLALLMLLGLSRAHATTYAVPLPSFTIKSAYDPNFCMALDGPANAVGTSVVIKRCNSQDNTQNWYQDNDQLKNVSNSLCVDVWNGYVRAGANLRMYNCHGNAHQQFTIWADKISPKSNLGYCFDVARADMRDGTHLILWDCQGQPNASWIKSKNGSDNEYFTIRSNVDPSFCLGLQRPADASGVSAVIKRCDVRDNTQAWYSLNGLLKNRSGDMCMDAWGGYVDYGTRLYTYTCHGQRNQRFAFVGNRINPQEYGNLCVVVNNNLLSEGNFVLLWDCGGMNSASWSKVSL